MIVVTAGDNAAIRLLMKAPDTIFVRVHDFLAIGSILEDDSAITLAYEHLTIHAVNGVDITELLGVLNLI